MASLLLPSSQPLSPLRIGALAFAFATHAVALALLVLPQQPPPAAPRAMTPMTAVEVVIAQIIPPPPVPPPPQPPTRRTARPVTLQPVAPVIPVESNYVVDVAPSEPDLPLAETDEMPMPPGRAAQIAYDDASPPPYPSIAQRRGWQGTVTLRVLVETDGRPIQVEIADSSGHTVLDRSARSHVLQRWRFQPAMQNGRLVRGWALVPVSFTLGAG